jgi:hypothetical protein
MPCSADRGRPRCLVLEGDIEPAEGLGEGVRAARLWRGR